MISPSVPHGWGQGLSATYWDSGVGETLWSSSGSWSRTMAHSSHAWCQFGGWGQASVSLSRWVCMECASVIQQQTPSWTQQQSGAPCRCKNIRQVESMGTGGYGVPVQWGYGSVCHFAAAPELDQLTNQELKGMVRRSGVLAGHQMNRRVMLYSVIRDSVCACEPGHWCVCAHMVLPVLLWCDVSPM